MTSSEVFPILCGLVLGPILAMVRAAFRIRAALATALVLGYVASAAAGELQISWSYLLLDAVQVGISAATGYAAILYLHEKKSKKMNV